MDRCLSETTQGLGGGCKGSSSPGKGRDKPPAVLGSPETAGRAAEERGRAGERKEVIVLDLGAGWRESR